MGFPKELRKKVSFREVFATVFLPACLWLGLWQVASLWVGQELLLPSPTAVAKTLAELIKTEKFWQGLAYSFLRVLAGILGGTVLGVLLALLTWFSVSARHIFAPFMKIVQATPVVSFILLVLLWTPRNTVPALVSGLMVLPLVWSSTEQGLEETNRDLLLLAQAYQFSFWKTCRLVYFPCAFPFFLTAVRNAIALGWKSGVAAEVICQPSLAVGTELSFSRLYLDTPRLFAWTAVVVVLSASMEWLLQCCIPRFTSWEWKTEKGEETAEEWSV